LYIRVSGVVSECLSFLKRTGKRPSGPEEALIFIWDNHRYSIANFILQLNVASIKYSFAHADEILAKINALKQYYVYASRNFFTSACVAVMWRIPPPNSNPSFEMSAIFSPWKLMTFSQCKTRSSLQFRDLFYCLW